MNSQLTFTFWDVQHGNTTHIITPNGRVVVIDMGDGESISGSARFSPLNFLRYTQGVKFIDKLIITHPHRDHLDDIENVFALNPSVVRRAGWLTEQEVRQGNRQTDEAIVSQYLQLCSKYTENVTRPNDTTFPDDWGGVTVKHYESMQVPRTNLNNHSIVTFVGYAGLKAMIPGDNESTSWNALLEQQQFRDEIKNVDVLLAPHHGRDAGYSNELFRAGLSPRITVISDDQERTTSVTSKYVNNTSGWTVYKPDGSSEKRYCVTTRNDGNITIKFGFDGSGGTFLNVTTQI